MPTLDHLDLAVSSLDESLAFYRNLLAPLGWRFCRQVVGERGETIHYLFGRNGQASLGLRQATSEAEAPYDRYSPGLHHLAFRASSRRQVNERATWLKKVGAEIESGPNEFDYSPGYYAVFFYDRDGFKLELVHRPPLRTLLWSFDPRRSPFRQATKSKA